MHSSFLEAVSIDWKQFEGNNVHDTRGIAAAAGRGRGGVDGLVEDMQLSSGRGRNSVSSVLFTTPMIV